MYRFVGIFRKRLVAANGSREEFLLFMAPREHLPGKFNRTGFSYSHLLAPNMRAADKPVVKFQDLRAVVMTKNERAQAAIPHQDKRNLSCLAWFSSPRGATCTTQLRREMKSIRRISHGNARSIESLRELRLPLVPTSNSRECLLQRMSDKA